MNDGVGTRSQRPLTVRLLVLAVFVAALGGAYALGLHHYLSLERLAENRDALATAVEQNYGLAVLAFCAVYILVVALSIPGATGLTLIGGLVFGTWAAGTYIVVAATLGATVVFWAARTVLGDAWVEKVGPWAKRMETGFQDNAMSYMLVLRLVPLFPFWVVNLVPAFLGVRPSIYVVCTLLGIIPGTFVYASVGNGLGAILDQGGQPDLTIIFAPEILGPLLALAALALIPVVYRKIQKARV